jgi:hypothetical protein
MPDVPPGPRPDEPPADSPSESLEPIQEQEATDKLEPITTILPDEVQKKQCQPKESQSIPVEREVLEPITTRLPDEVHKKQCDTATIPNPSNNDMVVAHMRTESPPESVNPPPPRTSVSVPTDNSSSLSFDKLVPIKQPTSISIPPANNRSLVFAKPKEFTDKADVAYRLQFGEPEQWPIAETIDPSEIYRKARGQLRKTGRTLGARRTFRRRNIR